MPPQLRLEYPGAVYHVVTSSIERMLGEKRIGKDNAAGRSEFAKKRGRK